MDAIESDLNQAIVRLNASPHFKGYRVDHMTISDTMVVSVYYDNQEQPVDPSSINAAGTAGLLTQKLIRTAARGNPGFAFRGAIVLGQHFCEKGRILGPAVDRCAELYEQPEGSFIILDPAYGLPDDPSEHHDTSNVFSYYAVPLKKHGPVNLAVVDPLEELTDRQSKLLRSQLLATFDRDKDRIDVLCKRQNTKAFLDHVAGRRPDRNEGDSASP